MCACLGLCCLVAAGLLMFAPLFPAAILNYTAQLSTGTYNGKQLTATQMSEAAKFLIHFFGDIHEPLHLGWAGDAGGNAYSGTFINANNVALHAVWDTNIIERRDNDFGGVKGYVNWLIASINASDPNAFFRANISAWATCKDPTVLANVCSDEWAEQGIEYACTYAYRDDKGKLIADGFNLQLPYYNR